MLLERMNTVFDAPCYRVIGWAHLKDVGIRLRDPNTCAVQERRQ